MKLSCYLLLFALLPLFCHSQTTYKTLRIGDKEIKIELTKGINVWESTYDSLVFKPKRVKFPFVNGKNGINRHIDPRNLQPYKKELIVDDNGLVYQRITTQVKLYEHEPYVKVNTLNDSVAKVVLPFHRVDTVMQINPITLEEEMVVSVDSITRVKYDLGAISKSQFKTDIENKFGRELEVTGIQMLCISDSSYWQEYYYHKLLRVEAAKYYPTLETVLNAPNADGLYAKIDKLKTGDRVILYIEFTVDKYSFLLHDLAVLTIKD